MQNENIEISLIIYQYGSTMLPAVTTAINSSRNSRACVHFRCSNCMYVGVQHGNTSDVIPAVFVTGNEKLHESAQETCSNFSQLSSC